MPDYRRMRQPGGTFFLTIVTYGRQRILVDPDNLARLRAAVRSVKAERPFELDGHIVLPDHMHMIMTLPLEDSDFSARIGQIKARFTKSLRRTGIACDAKTPARRRRREATVWQPRFWEHMIRNEVERERYMDYVYYNAVKHGLASCPHAWPHSSFHEWVKRGAYSAEWACACGERVGEVPDFSGLRGLGE